MDPNDILTTIGLFLPCCRWRRADESGIGCDIDRTDDSGVNVEAAAYGLGSWVPQGMGRSAPDGAAT